MTYEFNADDNVLNDFPNPFRIENRFLLTCTLLFAIGGFIVMVAARSYFQNHEDKVAIFTALFALALFGTAVKLGIQALSQMRFYLGRKFPIGLAPELKNGEPGTSAGASDVQEILRQRAIEFSEPTGPLSGVLYSLIKPLISSPPTIQYAALRHFHSFVGMAAILFSLAVSFFLFSGTPSEGIVSWLYLPLTGLSLVTPFVQQDENHSAPDSRSTLWKLVGLVAFAIIAPVLIPRYIPPFPVPPMWIAPFLLLVGSMVSSGLFLMSILAQLDNASATSVSCEQTTIAMNCPPSQLWTEISRDFQNNWSRNIPNRAYTNTPPDVSGAARGSFQGHIFEETQPSPTSTMMFKGMRDALNEPYARYLILLSAWGVMMSLAAVCLASYFAFSFTEMSRMEMSRSALTVFALSVGTLLAFRIGHLLWSRMYFSSRLVWIEVNGTFQTSELDIGNQITGNSRSRSTLTRVEDATLRVWVTDIVSVAFGKDSPRFIMALAPADGYAKATARRLIDFAADQSSVVAPTSNRDVQKTIALQAIGREFSPASTTATQLTAASGLVAQDDDIRRSQRKVSNADNIGVVKFFNPAKKFGFIKGDDGVERFFSGEQIVGEEVVTGQVVRYSPGQSSRGPSAKMVCAHS